MRCLRFSSVFLLAALCSSGQDLKEFEKKVTEFTLPNGLHFIVLERHEIPIVSFHTFVNAGSVDDPAGETGTARLLGRMAYKGSETIGTLSAPAEKKALDAIEEAYDRVEAEMNKGIKADQSRIDMLRNQARIAGDAAKHTYQSNEYVRILDENGATNRIATASLDSTSFAYSLPANRAELWFLLESQRLIHPVFRDFYQERDAQFEQYQQQLTVNPQVKLFAEFVATAFKTHPYRVPPDGWPGDIQHLRRSAARDFFERYYVPGNTTISIVGDANPADFKRMAERYFGPMAARPMPPRPPSDELPQEGPKTVVLESSGPTLLAVGYKRPDWYDKDDLCFDLMQFLFSQGGSGMLSRDLVQEKRLALQVRAGATFPSGRFPNLMVFFLVPAQGRTVEENVRGLEDLLQRFKSVLIDPQNLARAKAQLRSTFLRRITTNDDMAKLLATYHANYGDWRKMFTSMDELSKVTADSVQRAAEKYLVATGRTVAYTVAPGQSNLPPAPPKPQPVDRKTGGVN